LANPDTTNNSIYADKKSQFNGSVSVGPDATPQGLVNLNVNRWGMQSDIVCSSEIHSNTFGNTFQNMFQPYGITFSGNTGVLNIRTNMGGVTGSIGPGHIHNGIFIDQSGWGTPAPMENIVGLQISAPGPTAPVNVKNSYGAMIRAFPTGTNCNVGIFTDSMSVGSGNLTTRPPTNGMNVQGDVVVQGRGIFSSINIGGTEVSPLPLTGTLNRVYVTQTSDSIILTTPQDIHTGANFQANTISLGGAEPQPGVLVYANQYSAKNDFVSKSQILYSGFVNQFQNTFAVPDGATFTGNCGVIGISNNTLSTTNSTLPGFLHSNFIQNGILIDQASFYTPNPSPFAGGVPNIVGLQISALSSGIPVKNAYGAIIRQPLTGTNCNMGIFTDSMSVGSGNLTTSPPTNGLRVQGDLIAQSNMYIQGSINTSSWYSDKLTTPAIYGPTGSNVTFNTGINILTGGIVYGRTGPVVKYSTGTFTGTLVVKSDEAEMNLINAVTAFNSNPTNTNIAAYFLAASNVAYGTRTNPALTTMSTFTYTGTYVRHGGVVDLNLPVYSNTFSVPVHYELTLPTIIAPGINVPTSQLYTVKVGSSFKNGSISTLGGNNPFRIYADFPQTYAPKSLDEAISLASSRGVTSASLQFFTDAVTGTYFAANSVSGWPAMHVSYIIDSNTPYS
jgi:hypothetical protein